MKVTAELVKLFEREQKKYGTKVAVKNLLWLNAEKQLLDLGAKKVRTEFKGSR